MSSYRAELVPSNWPEETVAVLGPRGGSVWVTITDDDPDRERALELTPAEARRLAHMLTVAAGEATPKPADRARHDQPA